MMAATGEVTLLKLVLAHLALFTANAILGVGGVVSKIGLTGMNPVIFALLREMCAAPLLFAMSCMLEKRDGAPVASHAAAESRETRCFTSLDVVQFSIAGAALFGTNLGYIIGVKMLGGTPAAIWQSSLPIFTLCMGVCVGLEAFTVLKIAGCILAFAGCAFVSLYSDDTSEGGGEAQANQLTGNLIFLGQILSLAGFFVAEKPLLRRWTPLATLSYAYTIASVLMLFAGILINTSPFLLDVVCPDCHGNGWRVPPEAILAIAYWVLLGSVTGYFLLTWANTYVDASMVGAYFTVQPIGAVVASMIFIAATPGTDHFGLEGPGAQDFGVLGIFLGVGLLIYDARHGSAPASPPTGHGASHSALQPLTAQAAPSPSRTPISSSTSHDSILLAIRLAQAARTTGIRAGLSAEELPRYEPLRNAPPARTAPSGSDDAQGGSAREGRLW